ncbi:MAG: hypothetical protein J7L98_01785 [Candidatus Verstraetearchaeota archaeon]|nr:hypothetical protein [Candidatus Verstraetearchaeota archaeon]
MKAVLERAIEEYNWYRVLDAFASLFSLEGEEVTVLFERSFRSTCGFYDYIDDFELILEDLGINVQLLSVEETGWGAIVRFAVKIH